MNVAIEWVGGWLGFERLGPWPSKAAPPPGPVYVLLLGPLYVSIWPWFAREARAQMEWLRS